MLQTAQCSKEGENMAFKLVLELSDRDLEYYRLAMQEAGRRAESRGEKELLAATRRLLETVRTTDHPEFVRKRLDDLGKLNEMLDDAEWRIEGEDRERVVSALSYFAEPLDVIPDSVPGLGFLDDALMAELILRDLRHELEAYSDFCRYRENEERRRGGNAEVTRRDWLEAKRRQLFLRMERRRRERRRHHSTEPPTLPILRYRS
jgi:uncharacterized membrane protein YkvA (DUF1232 family)